MKKNIRLLLPALLSVLSFTAFSQAPVAYDVSIQGTPEIKKVLTGIYSYSDSLNRPEGNSIYRWYRADSVNQINPQLIDSAKGITYVTDSILDHNKFIAFAVTPVALDSTGSVPGIPVFAWTPKVISYVGIVEKYAEISIYPNPAVNNITIKTLYGIEKIEIITGEGRLAKVLTDISSERMDISWLKEGIYLLRISFTNGTTGYARMIKL